MPSLHQPGHSDQGVLITLTPRSLRENDAAAYCGFSGSYFRNLRTADLRRQAKGQAIEGPRWLNVGTAVRYLREDLDAWLDGHRVVPDQAEPEVTS